MRIGWSAGLLLLAGCGDGAPANVAGTTNATTAPTVADAVPALPKPAATPGPAAPPADAVAPDSATAAADVVRRYEAAIAARRYGVAYRLWEPDAAGMTAQAFAASFARYAEYRADVGTPGRIDAGAGQRYVTVPVRISGTLRQGGRFALEGPITLHHVADIDGAGREQREWRIRSSDLTPRPR